jgi:hypothetical protein
VRQPQQFTPGRNTFQQQLAQAGVVVASNATTNTLNFNSLPIISSLLPLSDLAHHP